MTQMFVESFMRLLEDKFCMDKFSDTLNALHDYQKIIHITFSLLMYIIS